MHRHIFRVLSLAEFNMSHHYQGRAGDKNQLQRPQTDVGDGEDVVIADVGAARLEKTGNIQRKMIAIASFCNDCDEVGKMSNRLLHTRDKKPGTLAEAILLFYITDNVIK